MQRPIPPHARSIAAPARLRSLLFAPAVRPDFVEKLPSRGADGVVIDCEDATPPNAKAEGRRNARSLAPEIAGRGTRVFVRVNAVASAWFRDDVAEGLAIGLAGIVVPKVETLGQLDAVDRALTEAGHTEMGVLAGLETALGVADARSLLAHPRVTAAYFGAEDFIADMGGVRTTSNMEVMHARSVVALAGRLSGVLTLDQIVADFRNDAAFVAEAGEARAMGFRGKLCIHPRQVPLANAAFVPASEEVAHATRLLAAYDAASASGLAAIEFEGQMVDEPLAVRARQVLAAVANEDGGRETAHEEDE